MQEFAPELEYGRVFSAAKEFGRQVTIITYDSLLSKLESGEINPDDYDAVMLDEAHKVLGEQRKSALDKFDKQLIVGFTATPDYSETKKLSNVLPKKIHEMTVREAVYENLLCSASSVVVHTEADLSSVEVDKDKYSKKQLEDAVNIESRNQAAIKIYKSNFEGQTALAYCVSIKHAERVAAEFNQAGVPAASINGSIQSDAQDKILEQFKNGEIKVLCNAALLIEGFDEPEASVCLNLCPTMSRIDAEQRGGRVLRVNKNDPQKHATVVDFLDKGITAANMPILFSVVAGGAIFLPKGKEDVAGGGGTRNGPKEFIEIPDLEVTYRAEEVMKLIGKMKEEIEKVNDYDALKIAVQSAFKSGEALQKSRRSLVATYDELQSKHPNWVKHPEQLDNFVSYYDLFGIEKMDYTSLKVAIKAAIEAGEVVVDPKNLGKSYDELRKKHPYWVLVPRAMDGFVSIQDLFGIEKMDYTSLKAAIQTSIKAGEIIVDIKSLKKTYADLQKIHPEWVKYPQAVVGFVDWEDLFGMKKTRE